MFRSRLFAGITLGVAMAAGARPQELQTTRILFIGNSYTYFNNLPEILGKLAEAGHRGRVETMMIAPGGWGLRDHWEKGTGRQLLVAQKWDFVVLQDQSTLGMNYWVEGKDHVKSDAVFRPHAEKWAATVQAKGAMPVFFLTWAGKDAPEDQPALDYAYVRAARDTRSLLAPVGIVWEAVRRDYPQIGLFYEGHGSHPSPAGSYLTACVLYATIFRQSPVGLPSKITGTPVSLDTEKPETGRIVTLVDLNADDAEALQTEAWTISRRTVSTGGYPAVLPPHPPSVPPLPTGLPLSESDLNGTWEGRILFYPVGPADIVLYVNSPECHLEIRYHSKDFPDESVALSDFHVQGSKLSFSVPKSVGVDNMSVRLTAVMPTRGQLRGTAEASRETGNAHVVLLGSWTAKKATLRDGLAPN